mgnify:FL=1
MNKDINHYKDLLDKELSVLEGELKTVGRKNPDHSSDWEAVEGEAVTDTAEDGDVAEGIEQYDNNTAILKQLELRLNDVKNALAKIDAGTYGVCDVCSNEIEDDRLDVNPSASTCKEHMN